MIDVKRNLELLSCMNPNGMQHGVTNGGADLCKWAVGYIRLLLSYAHDCPHCSAKLERDARLK